MPKVIKEKEIRSFLEKINNENVLLHKKYEDYFWKFNMGDHSCGNLKDLSIKNRDSFRSNEKHLSKVNEYLKVSTLENLDRLKLWKKFFESYQIPKEAKAIKTKIDKLESVFQKKKSTQKEGYIDPYTNKFTEASSGKMAIMSITNDDDKVRKACFEARNKRALEYVDDLIKLVKTRNEFARKIGFEDFYAYKLMTEEGMKKKDLFKIFNKIYSKTKYAFKYARDLEKKKPGLRLPWNFGYMMSGSFKKEMDPYFDFVDSIRNWGRSFAGLGVDFQKSKITLDLLDRKGKYNNGFCHWPDLVYFDGEKRIPGTSNFTCNLVLGQVGAGFDASHTLFHEGGHAAHMLNTEMRDSCVNSEYAPMSTAWAETQSMFMDSMFSSIEWRLRYAENKKGEPYPIDLYKRMVKKLSPMSPLSLYGILSMCEFEKIIYEKKDITSEFVIKTAAQVSKKYMDRSVPVYTLLSVPHLYSWESACSYHGYGLAELAVAQWREYFYKKYGHIVDNKKVGEEMKKVWSLGSSKTFYQFVQVATEKNLSADSFINSVTKNANQTISTGMSRIKKLSAIPKASSKFDLNATVVLSDGKKEIANSKAGFDKMLNQYKVWLKTIKR